MHVIILEKKENPFLNRVEVKGKINFEGVTPSNAQVRDTLANELKVKEADLIVVKHIYTNFSHQEAKFMAMVYNTKEAKNTTEKRTSQIRKKAEEVKKAAGEKKEGEQ